MSLLTKIYNLKSKYKSTDKNIDREKALINELNPKMNLAAKSYAEADTAYKAGIQSYLDAYDTTGVDTSASDFDYGKIDWIGIQDAYGDKLIEDFKGHEHSNLYAWTTSQIERMGRENVQELVTVNDKMAGVSNWANFLKAEAYFKQTVTDPLQKMTGADWSELEEKGKTYTTSFETYSGYKGDIDEANQRMIGYGATQQEIQGMLTDAEQMYGMSTEQRKRGTRGSARRRSALTSRSGYA
tara:strand:+ start:34 stop:756 length:723 start_codon:yes stop_codon:yes gene_type:complete